MFHFHPLLVSPRIVFIWIDKTRVTIPLSHQQHSLASLLNSHFDFTIPISPSTSNLFVSNEFRLLPSRGKLEFHFSTIVADMHCCYHNHSLILPTLFAFVVLGLIDQGLSQILIRKDTDYLLRTALPPSIRKYVHYNRLNYGSNCSWAIEQQVKTIWTHYAAHLTSDDPKIVQIEGIDLLKALTDLINTKTPLCDYYKKLACDEVSSTCLCLEGTLFGMPEVKTVRQEDRCVLTSNSPCVTTLKDLNVKDLDCEKGSLCRSTQTGQNCTQETFLGARDEKMANPDASRLQDDVCLCSKANPKLASLVILLYAVSHVILPSVGFRTIGT